jgi:tRNA threonylcarbamoyladenosine biosynthesis protein TsaB
VIVLAFDTSTRVTAVGLRLADASTLCAHDDPAEDARPGHATRLLGMADDLLVRARVAWDEIERIAVGIGPGRFTGLRVGVATARGLAQSLGVGLVGVPTLRALAEPALAAGDGPDHVLAVIDALRGELFAAGFATAAGGAACEVEFGAPLSARDLGAAISASGPAANWCAVGDGAVRYRAELESAGVLVPDDCSPLHRVDGAAMCELATRLQPSKRLEEVVPDYRRRPDAEGVRHPGVAGKSVAELQAVPR